LCSVNVKCGEILGHFVDGFSFAGTDVIQAIRRLACAIGIPGEAQKIGRLFEAFAESYYKQNKNISPFPSADSVYTFTFAVIMLNTDLHNSSIRQKMTVEQFLNLVGNDLPEALRREAWNSVFNKEIVFGEQKK